MAFPHPKSRKDNYRKIDKPKKWEVLQSFRRRTINVTEDRKGKEDVNPAKKRTSGALVHDVVMGGFVMMSDDIGGAPHCRRPSDA